MTNVTSFYVGKNYVGSVRMVTTVGRQIHDRWVGIGWVGG